MGGTSQKCGPGWAQGPTGRWAGRSAGRGTGASVAQQGIHKVPYREGAQIVDAFPHADKADGLGALAGNGGDDPALGGAVQLGQHQAGDVERLIEGFHLSQGVLADIGVQHQDHLVGAGGVRFLNDPAHLGDFFHEVQLGG